MGQKWKPHPYSRIPINNDRKKNEKNRNSPFGKHNELFQARTVIDAKISGWKYEEKQAVFINSSWNS